MLDLPDWRCGAALLFYLLVNERIVRVNEAKKREWAAVSEATDEKAQGEVL
jgi:hypothetical protein